MTNTFGERFRVTTWGESHGPAVGAVVDGCPAGLRLAVSDFVADLERDIPDAEIGTPRREPNHPEILSGVFEGLTLGTPIMILIKNEDVRSGQYLERRDRPRPGHADLTWRQCYGHVDPRGGGRSSGRECVARLAAGAVARKLLATRGVVVRSEVVELAGIPQNGPAEAEKAHAEVKRAFAEGDSTGGIVSVIADGLPSGLGDPVFGKLSSRLGHALLGIGGVKSFEVGAGREHARLRGSESNDPIGQTADGPRPLTNRAGGVLGGISTGLPLVLTLAVKPTPTLRVEQETVDLSRGEPAKVLGLGRFDMNFAPRVAVIGEAMVALVLADVMIGRGHIHPTRISEPEG